MESINLKRRVFIPTGFVSLMLLPIVFFILLDRYPNRVRPHTMEVYLLPEDLGEPFFVDSHSGHRFTPRRFRKIPINITQERLVKDDVSRIVSSYTYDLLANRDSISCLVVSFERTVPYGRFVDLMDDLNAQSDTTYKHGWIRYVLHEGKYYIAFIPYRKIEIPPPFYCGYAFMQAKEQRISLGRWFSDYATGLTQLISRDQSVSRVFLAAITVVGVAQWLQIRKLIGRRGAS